MSRSFRPWIVLAVFALAAFVLLKPASTMGADFGGFPQEWFWHEDDAARAKHLPLLGKPMPPLQVADPLVEKFEPGDLKGKIVVLDFWATWCGPCIKAIPHNNAMAEKYKDRNVMVIGICTANGQEKYRQVVETRGVKYPSVRDLESKTAESYAVQWYPTYVVIDRSGNVRAIGVATDKVEAVIDRLLEEDKK